jgi:hypothetical protein
MGKHMDCRDGHWRRRGEEYERADVKRGCCFRSWIRLLSVPFSVALWLPEKTYILQRFHVVLFTHFAHWLPTMGSCPQGPGMKAKRFWI